MWGMFHVIVDTAVVYHNIRCEDFYGSWIRALFVSLPVR
jgi:aryl-alcohol dehydrogenase-like predicted oxidoreductase